MLPGPFEHPLPTCDGAVLTGAKNGLPRHVHRPSASPGRERSCAGREHLQAVWRGPAVSSTVSARLASHVFRRVLKSHGVLAGWLAALSPSRSVKKKGTGLGAQARRKGSALHGASCCHSLGQAHRDTRLRLGVAASAPPPSQIYSTAETRNPHPPKKKLCSDTREEQKNLVSRGGGGLWAWSFSKAADKGSWQEEGQPGLPSGDQSRLSQEALRDGAPRPPRGRFPAQGWEPFAARDFIPDLDVGREGGT